MTESVMIDATRIIETMPRPLRLHRLVASQYKAVFAEKRSFYGQTIAVWAMFSADADRKVGVIVSKRLFRHAVDRNRAKRLMREAFRLTSARLVPGVHLILIARSGIRGRKSAEVIRDLERVAKRANLLQSTLDKQ